MTYRGTRSASSNASGAAIAGQKHDVVVVNFVDLSNEADKRVYELLAQKFQLFEGVLGPATKCWVPSVQASISSGVSLISTKTAEAEEIKSSFEQLRLDLSGEISDAMVKTRQLLLENFDEECKPSSVSARKIATAPGADSSGC